MADMIETFSSPDEFADAAAAAVLEELSRGLDERGAATLVATGGRSPAPVYDRLSAAKIDWAKVSVTLSDERLVPPDAPDSNERLVRAHLLQGPAAAARFVPLYSPTGDPQAAAERAEPALRKLTPFDSMLLGMGEDGHVASLVPGSPVLAQGMDLGGEALLLGVPAGVGSPPLARITLTLPALLQARAILLLISGPRKREVVAEEAGLPVHALLEQAKGRVRILWTP
jgi:6-phosphogluconolactonase